MREEEKLKMMVEEPDLVRCSECSGAMYYKAKEVYQCELCGHTYLSNFGRVKQYLDEHGPRNMVEICEDTGVSRKAINRYVREGRLQLIGSNGSLFSN